MFFCEMCGSGDCCERTDIHGGPILCDTCYMEAKQDQEDKDAIEEIFKDNQRYCAERIIMNGLIGMWLMFSAVIFGCICLFGMDFTFKQKIWAMVHFEMFITALLAGACFLSK